MGIRRVLWLLSRLIANERKYLPKYGVSIPTAIKLWSKGHFSYAAEFYDLDRLDLYLSDADQHRTLRIDGAMGQALRNKYVFKQLLGQHFTDHLPETLCFVRNGRPTAAHGPDTVLDAIDDCGSVICKPVARGRGKDVHRIDAGERYRFDGEPTTREEVAAFTSSLDEYLIESAVDQHPFETAVFPDAVNTMRILTMVDPDTGEPFLGATVHRFGVPGSAPTDNFSQGGIVADIDPETGELAPAVTVSESSKRRLERHPATDTRIAGERVPNWSGVRELVLSAAAEFSSSWPYVGWDIAMNAEGEPIIIEGNRATDVDVLQLNEPLLADDRCRRFYEYHGIV